jgi:hypothetical protein
MSRGTGPRFRLQRLVSEALRAELTVGAKLNSMLAGALPHLPTPILSTPFYSSAAPRTMASAAPANVKLTRLRKLHRSPTKQPPTFTTPATVAYTSPRFSGRGAAFGYLLL